MSTALSSAAALRLSEEAQDLICSHVASFSNTDAMNTLYSLALTSKAFLESSQHALYKAPLRALLARPTWPRAEALLLTLQTRPGLALHIRQLYALESIARGLFPKHRVRKATDDDDVLAALTTRALSLSSSDVSKEAACVWAWRVASLSTHTTGLSLPMTSVSHAQRWAAISPSLPQVSSVRIGAKAPFAIDFKTFESCAQGWNGRQMRKVALQGLEWTEAETKGSKSRLPFSAQELLIEDVHLSAFQLLRCLPKTLSSLKSLTISSYGPGSDAGSRGSSASFETLFRLVGKRLRTFSFTALHERDVQDVIDDYGYSHNGPTLPLAAFQAFPLVTSLTLRYLADMTPNILAEIARSSPKLKTLDLKWTTWKDIQLDGEEEALVAALNSFERLKKINLGYFAVDEEDGWELDCVMEWADEKGVELQWQGCVYGEEEDSEEDDGCYCPNCTRYYSDGFCDDSDCEGDCGSEHVWDE